MKLELYYMPECPYCVRVLNSLEKLNKNDVILKNIHESNYSEELIKLGGKKQVPMLSIDGQALYESMDIIKFLENL